MGLLNVVESSYCTSWYYEQRHRRRLRWRNHACSDRVKYSYIRLAIGLLSSLGASLASQTQKAIYAEVACETAAGFNSLYDSSACQYVYVYSVRATMRMPCAIDQTSAVTSVAVIAGSALKFSQDVHTYRAISDVCAI